MFWEWVKSKIDQNKTGLLMLLVLWGVASVLLMLIAAADAKHEIAAWVMNLIGINTIMLGIVTAVLNIKLAIEGIRHVVNDYREFKLTYKNPKRKRIIEE